METDDFTAVARLDQLRPDEGTVVRVADRSIALFLHGDAVRAIDDVCPHMGASLGGGRYADGIVECPWHGWRFRVDDGAWVSCPNNRNQVFEVRVEGGVVFVRVPPKKSNYK